MEDDNITDKISVFLQRYANAIRDQPVPSRALVRTLRKQPEATFKIVSKGLYRMPAGLDFRDLDDPLIPLLSAVADLVPRLLTAKMTKGYWAARYLYISAAAASKSPVFLPTLLALLVDRSRYIKTLVLQLIIMLPHLRVPEAMPKLEKLTAMRSFQRSGMDRELLESAKRCVLEGLGRRKARRER